MEQLKHNFRFADEVKVEIPLTTAYQWGPGWENFEDQFAFEHEVYPKITDAGYILDNPGGDSAPTIKKDDWRSRMSLYFHPMEIKGYAPMEDVDKIIDILKTCKSIKKVGEPEITRVYNADDLEYKWLLVDHSKEILEWIKEERKNGRGMYICEDFVEQFRVPRFGDTSDLITSADVDYHFVYTFEKIAKNLGLLE